MSYVIKAVLSNPRNPECGQFTIPFPIPVDQYDQTIDMLQAMELGGPVNRDCRVDVIDSRYSVLGALEGKDGKVYYHYASFLGYRKGPDGLPEIDPDEAAIVCRIFSRYLLGQSVQRICRDLMADGIKTAQGRDKWYDSVVQKMLQNGCGKITLNQQSLDTSGVALI